MTDHGYTKAVCQACAWTTHVVGMTAAVTELDQHWTTHHDTDEEQ